MRVVSLFPSNTLQENKCQATYITDIFFTIFYLLQELTVYQVDLDIFQQKHVHVTTANTTQASPNSFTTVNKKYMT